MGVPPMPVNVMVLLCACVIVCHMIGPDMNDNGCKPAADVTVEVNGLGKQHYFGIYI